METRTRFAIGGVSTVVASVAVVCAVALTNSVALADSRRRSGEPQSCGRALGCCDHACRRSRHRCSPCRGDAVSGAERSDAARSAGSEHTRRRRPGCQTCTAVHRRDRGRSAAGGARRSCDGRRGGRRITRLWFVAACCGTGRRRPVWSQEPPRRLDHAARGKAADRHQRAERRSDASIQDFREQRTTAPTGRRRPIWVGRSINRAIPQTDAIDRWPASPARPFTAPGVPQHRGLLRAGRASLPAVAGAPRRSTM